MVVATAAAQVRAHLPPGVDGWGYSLKGMMGMVVLGGLLITGTYWALQRTVVPKVKAGQPKKKKQKPNMSVGESFTFLAKSPYIRDLALLVRTSCLLPFSLCLSDYKALCIYASV
jgi:AAA family ATP:ADP antiporter